MIYQTPLILKKGRFGLAVYNQAPGHMCGEERGSWCGGGMQEELSGVWQVVIYRSLSL